MNHPARLPVLCALLLLSACGELLGGAPPEDQILDGPIEGLSGAQLRTFLAGDEAFRTQFTPAQGLGPVFNATSCDGCHAGDGKGHPGANLTRFGRGDAGDAALFDYLADLGGAQLQDHAIPGYAPEVLPDGVSGMATSVRSGPAVAGLGLIEAIPDEAILALADPDDRDGDGISGRPNFVLPPPFLAEAGCACPGCKLTPAGCKRLGRFGRKATAVSLLQQVAGAYHDDMGLTTEEFDKDVYNPLIGPTGDAVPDPEVPSSTLQATVFYMRTVRPPTRREADHPAVLRGEGIFAEIGCAACHVPALGSGPSPIAPLARRRVPLYSDLLLHDLGPALADGYPEGEATGREWRTTPLWGMGLIPNLLGGIEYYLHDGRARSIEEAIRLHGGEAEGATARFAALPQGDRADLLRFLRSL